MDDTKSFRDYIGGVPLWGKKVSESGRKVAHCENLDTYFGDLSIKMKFLSAFKDCFNDDMVRKMVLEVNSGNNDLLSIISDLKSVGIQFV